MPVTYPCGLAHTFAGLTETRRFMGFAGITTHDQLILELLDGVTSDFQNYMDRYIFINDWTEKFDMEFTDEHCIQPKEYPLWTVAGLTDNDLPIAASDYEIYSGEGAICMPDVHFTRGMHTVELTYRAGYSVECLPPKLVLACKQEVSDRFQTREGDIVSEKIGDYSYKRETHKDSSRRRTYGLSPRTMRVLDYFRDGAL